MTTQQIADKADIGTGTLFHYVRSKGELLLSRAKLQLCPRTGRGQQRRFAQQRYSRGDHGDPRSGGGMQSHPSRQWPALPERNGFWRP
ncbi:helix-turn-helix domain-containing protein [Paeniglutamicibacter sp. Y32M11]|uniref:helix-turn-helix domain-containing protein n=1 Tax=Paeniglutamicibacter sp. Y32M11 TaxID=2853258 RepID=UPI00351CCCEF